MNENIGFCNRKNWLSLLFRLGAISYDKAVAAYQDILERYSEPHRKYHNINHINHCLAELETVRHLAVDVNVLELAIWYHDAIYEIQANDNEERSAILAQGVMGNLNLPAGLINKVKNIIIATKHNSVPESFDAKLMLDIDISNLGDAEKFKATNKLVREEYSSVPDNLFINGRSNILQSFIDRPSIYLTEFFRDKYEKAARENIKASITPVIKSNDWDNFFDLVKQNPNKRLSGFPFNEKFPKMYSGKKYQIILVSGIIIEARVDDSREFMSEGLEWKTAEGNKSRAVVAAWRLL